MTTAHAPVWYLSAVSEPAHERCDAADDSCDERVLCAAPHTTPIRLTVACVDETRAALYIDFDNFLGGLIATDPTSAVEVAMNPSRWLSRLTYAQSAEDGRK